MHVMDLSGVIDEKTQKECIKYLEIAPTREDNHSCTVASQYLLGNYKFRGNNLLNEQISKATQ
ncbi:hypothetical protein [endosymbiont GvMRE of Glomus versiforme]|uniref:hypothetical protein n=1 Tax=endosymbiont GvMRE of Glomus versiforme TaxID=2039283 RepID=UPI000ED9A33D|nr:hypothetical protein [endosymbiont GvMRE of Glomus versiforme]RHZ35353.1 hypothetical protein GvMRE_IIg546 [endosymbiont GvMRE of Glomus versiforme]